MAPGRQASASQHDPSPCHHTHTHAHTHAHAFTHMYIPILPTVDYKSILTKCGPLFQVILKKLNLNRKFTFKVFSNNITANVLFEIFWKKFPRGDFHPSATYTAVELSISILSPNECLPQTLSLILSKVGNVTLILSMFKHFSVIQIISKKSWPLYMRINYVFNTHTNTHSGTEADTAHDR